MKRLIEFLAIGGAGFLGAITRYVVSLLCAGLFDTRFPIGTMVINITGSLFLGWFMTVVSTRVVVSDAVRLGIGVGFVGAYTTFSTYMYESNALISSGAWIKAMVNLIGSLVLGLIAVRLGILLAQRT